MPLIVFDDELPRSPRGFMHVLHQAYSVFSQGWPPRLPQRLARTPWRRLSVPLMIEIFLGGLDVLSKVTILLSLLGIGHFVEFGLAPEFEVVVIVLSTQCA